METPLERCLIIAKDAGCPKDQVERFLPFGYVPLPWQWLFHSAAREADLPNGPTQIMAGGARGPGKTHAIFAQGTLDDSQRVENLKGLFLRKTGKAAKESLDDLVTKVLAGKIEHEYGAGVIRFPNGSRVILGGFKDERDIDNYIGQEYDWIAVEEANQLGGAKITLLQGSLRSSKDGWRPRMYLSCNPGGVGHGWVKKTFVEPFKRMLQRLTRFIPASYTANPFNNPEYRQFLEGLTGQIGKAWREGNFDILAGEYFTEWSEAVHVCEPFDIPAQWRRFCCLDYGHDASSALYWIAVSPKGQLFVYRELYRNGLTYSDLADEFVSMTPLDEKIEYLVADPSIWAKKGEDKNGLSGAEIFGQRYKELTDHDIRMMRANNDRLNGWMVVREYLKPFMQEGKTTAKLQVFTSCPDLIRTFPEQAHDDHNPEDLNTDLEDHAMDSIRYGLMSRPTPAKPAEDISLLLQESPTYPDIGI